MQKSHLSIILILLLGCNSGHLITGDLISWVEDEGNGLRVTKQISNYKFQLQYKLLEYIIAQEILNKNLTREEIEARMEEKKDMQYLTLRIGSADERTSILETNLTDRQEYYERLDYFAFQMKKDLILVDGTDTLGCSLYHFERTYNLTPFNNIVLGFANPGYLKEAKDKTLIYKDNILDIGAVKLTIKASSLEDMPKLKLI